MTVKNVRATKAAQKAKQLAIAAEEALTSFPDGARHTLEKAIENGYITHSDFSSTVKLLEITDLNLVDKVYDLLMDQKVDLLSEKKSKTAPVSFEDLKKRDKRKHHPELLELSRDSVRMFLSEIGKIPLLKAEEERKWSRQFLKWEKVRNELKEKAKEELGEEETDKEKIEAKFQELLAVEAAKKENKKIIKDSDFAKNKLIVSNLRLVVSIAKKYMRRGLDLMDLVQEGSIGLIRAVEKFDPEKGFKFSTYATWWVRQAVTRAIADQARTIRIPVHMIEIMNKISHTSRRLSQDLGREPTPEEIAAEMDISVDKLIHIRDLVQDTISLDAPVGGAEDSATMANFVPDTDSESPSSETERTLTADDVNNMLSNLLTPREEYVIRTRMGIQHPSEPNEAFAQEHTLEEVGMEFGVTRERIRQIEANIYLKLRNHPRFGQYAKVFGNKISKKANSMGITQMRETTQPKNEWFRRAQEKRRERMQQNGNDDNLNIFKQST